MTLHPCVGSTLFVPVFPSGIIDPPGYFSGLVCASGLERYLLGRRTEVVPRSFDTVCLTWCPPVFECKPLLWHCRKTGTLSFPETWEDTPSRLE